MPIDPPGAPTIDHIVLAVPDLAAGVAWFRRMTGVAPRRGGSHTGLGTANHLVGLGGTSYLEIIGPDPEQPRPAAPRPFGIDALDAARVVAWCVRPPDLDRCIATAAVRGYHPGAPRAMSRRTPGGALLSWRLTPPASGPGDGVVPFLIDWGATPHPTAGALPTLPLRSLSAEHPDPAGVRARLAALDVDLPVRPAAEPRLLVTLERPDGPIVLS